MSRGRGMSDPEVWGKRVRPHTNPDQGEPYEQAAWPEGWDDLDPDRHCAEFCYPTWGEVRRSWGHLRVQCLDCKDYVIASTRAELDLLMAEHCGGGS